MRLRHPSPVRAGPPALKLPDLVDPAGAVHAKRVGALNANHSANYGPEIAVVRRTHKAVGTPAEGCNNQEMS